MNKILALLGALLTAVLLTSVAAAEVAPDPRIGLSPGLDNAGVAANGLELLAHQNKPAGFFDPNNPGNFGFVNSDLSFEGDRAYVGNFNGFQIYDISDPDNPAIVTAVVCPGGQGEVSVFGNLLFMSVEETRGRIDCGTQGAGPGGVPERRALPWCPHLRHLERGPAGAGGRRADVPRLAHAHDPQEPARRREPLRLRQRHRRRAVAPGARGLQVAAAGHAAEHAAVRPGAVAVADRSDPRSARRAAERGRRQHVAADGRSGDGADQHASRTPIRPR